MIVETVEPGSLAASVGLRPGDRLLTYTGHPLPSPAALLGLEENTFGVDSVTLVVEREGERLEFVLNPGKLGVEVRPGLPADVAAGYERGRAAFEATHYAEAAHCWSEAAQHTQEKPVSAWLFARAGEAWERVSDWQAAQFCYERAGDLLADGQDRAALSLVWTALGRCRQNRNDYEAAKRWYEQAQRSDEQMNRPLWGARALNNLGVLAWRRRDPALAHDYYTRAFDLFERLAPGSLDVANNLNNLGSVALERGDLALAHDYYTCSLDIQERLAPGSLKGAMSLNNLGIVASRRGDLASAHHYYARALDIFERLVPDSAYIAGSLSNLGIIAWQRGDLALAHDYSTRALTIKERLVPGSLDLAISLNNLGLIAWQRGDLPRAHDYHLRALDIKERLAPGSPDVAPSLMNLGIIALERGDLASAQDYYTRALAIQERFAPGSLETAPSLTNLGMVLQRRGDLVSACTYHLRALDLFERLAPNALDTAECLSELGRTLLLQDRSSDALPHYQHAVRILEHQREQIQAGEARALLLAQHADKFAGLIRCHLALDQPEDAFSTLERARARSLLELLADRNLDLAAEAPAQLLLQQQDLDQRRAQAYDQLSQLSTSADNAASIEDLHRALRELERRQQVLTAQIRAASPHYASLQYPQPLDLKATQTALDPGTLLLSYLVDKEQTFLFAVTIIAIEAYTLPLGRETLEEQVGAFLRTLDVRLIENDAEQATAQGRRLYSQLIGPVQSQVRTAKRLLLCPDGPLQTLPFGALVTNTGRRPRYLGAEKPLHTTVSATIYVQTREESVERLALSVEKLAEEATREEGGGRRQEARTVLPLEPSFATGQIARRPLMAQRLLAFGDPLYSASEDAPTPSSSLLPPSSLTATSDAELSMLQTRGLSRRPLPHTRAEVEGIRNLFGEAATVRLGAEATKRAALTESPEADILHFACHGWLDPAMPLSSGLVLSQAQRGKEQATESESGLLQAWEILSNLRLKADLVVLSACQSGLGQEVRGEGLIGLTRAFQYAGAKSLVVSLWEVDDASTAAFMRAFYAGIKAGESKDEALQQAARELQGDARWNAPFYWSAFVLVGDRL